MVGSWRRKSSGDGLDNPFLCWIVSCRTNVTNSRTAQTPLKTQFCNAAEPTCPHHSLTQSSALHRQSCLPSSRSSILSHHLVPTPSAWPRGHVPRGSATLPAAHSASSVFPQSCRIHRQWAWPVLTQSGPARSSDCPCSYPAAARPPGSP